MNRRGFFGMFAALPLALIGYNKPVGKKSSAGIPMGLVFCRLSEGEQDVSITENGQVVAWSCRGKKSGCRCAWISTAIKKDDIRWRALLNSP